MIDMSQSQSWMVTAATGAISFVLGLLVPRFWMTKKESKDVEQANYDNSLRLVELHDIAFTSYSEAIKNYCDAHEANFEIFNNISVSGVKYFYQVSIACDAILSDKVDRQIRDNTLMPKIRDVASRTLVSHYDILQKIAKKKNFTYSGKLRREDYQGIFAVVEKFGVK